MEFCPKCGSVLEEKRSNFGCVRCGHTVKSKVKLGSSEKIKSTQEIGVVKEKDTDVFPTSPNTCPKCGYKEAYFWTSQTRSGDEAETRFFKCVKCKHTWREYK
ncbi:transcription factor S [Candidatus Pacearchaeota archaeon]|nr:transcription factor S [Candidatus Pacearchaeota archaeon]